MHRHIRGGAWTNAEPHAQETPNLTNGGRLAGRLDRLTAATHGDADHLPQLQAKSPVDPPNPDDSAEGNGH